MNIISDKNPQDEYEWQDTLLREAWETMKEKYPSKVGRVKRVFVIDMTRRLVQNIREKCIQAKRPDIMPYIDEVMEYVLTYHYFYTGRLSDDERAKSQRNEVYKTWLFEMLNSVIISEINRIKPVVVTTKYEPEISSIMRLCDSAYRVLHYNSSPIICRVNNLERYGTIRSLLMSSIILMRSILLQLVDGFSKDAMITWRSLLELEYKMLVLVKYESLEPRFREFAEYEFADEEETPELYEQLRRRATADGWDPRRAEYRNYGWVLALDGEKKSYPSLKTLFKLVGDEERYSVFKTASGFTHASLNVIHNSTPSNTYHFLIRELSNSVQNISHAMSDLLTQHGVEYDDEDSISKEYADSIDAYRIAMEQYFKNYAYDTQGENT